MHTETSSKRIILLNASALKQLACPLKFYRTVFEGYQKSQHSIDMVYGSAFHLFVQTMVGNGGAYPEAIKKAVDLFNTTPYTEKATKKWMNAQHLTKTCVDYWEHYNSKGHDKDGWNTVRVEGKPITELKFATLPFYEDDRCSILLVGTIDDICKIDGGCYVIRDYKTTSSWDIDGYLHDYILNSQLIFYVYALYWYAKHYPDSIYAKITSQGRVAAAIDGLFLKAGNTPSAQTIFKRSEMFFFTDKDLGYFEEMIRQVVVPKILGMLDREPYPEGRLNGACTIVYGRCEFFNSCAAPDSISRKFLLDNDFITKPYDPLHYD